MMTRLLTLYALVFVLLCACPAPADAQVTLPPPAGPLLFCGQQAAPAATSYALLFDGGEPEPITALTPATASADIVAACNADAAGWTHAFTIPAARFTVRPDAYMIVIRARNEFGSTDGPGFEVRIGVAPGKFTVHSVRQLPAQ